MGDMRQKTSSVLAFAEEGRSEAPMASREGTEPSTAGRNPERQVRQTVVVFLT